MGDDYIKTRRIAIVSRGSSDLLVKGNVGVTVRVTSTFHTQLLAFADNPARGKKGGFHRRHQKCVRAQIIQKVTGRAVKNSVWSRFFFFLTPTELELRLVVEESRDFYICRIAEILSIGTGDVLIESTAQLEIDPVP